jgi:hypothetical protein
MIAFIGYNDVTDVLVQPQDIMLTITTPYLPMREESEEWATQL